MDELLGQFGNPWVIFGFTAQAIFFLRFFVQWVASERQGRTVIPIAFWWLSIAGATGLLIYAVFKLRDPVIILGQTFGLLIYSRNLWLIRRERSAATAAVPTAHPVPPPVRKGAEDAATVDARH